MQRFQTHWGLVVAVPHTRVPYVQYEHLLYSVRLLGSCKVLNVIDRDIVRYDQNALCSTEIQPTVGVHTLYVCTLLAVPLSPKEHFDRRSRSVHKDFEGHYVGLGHHNNRVDTVTDFDTEK